MEGRIATQAPAVTVDAPASQFYIPATASLQERRPRILKHGDAFAVFDHYGDIISVGRTGPEGLYRGDTRFLSHLELRIGGERPLLLSSTVQDDNTALMVDLTNPDRFEDGRLLLARDTIHLHRAKFIWNDACYERIALLNYDDRAHRVTLSLSFDADFADIFEIRGQKRPRRGQRTARCVSPAAVAIRYTGLDDVVRGTTIRFDPAPTRLTPEEARFDLELQPRRRASLFVRVSSHLLADDGWQGRQFFICMRQAQRALRNSASRATAIESTNALFNEVVRRSVADLYTLITDTEQGPFPYAGIPWFSTAFGRDAIITALMTLWLDPEIAKGVLRFLAATQAKDADPFRDAEPGKILHEMRNGEMARLREVPFGLYYGSVDSTPLFLVLAGEYLDRTGDLETVRALWPNLQAAMRWIDTYGDIDGDGFVEYSRKEASGLLNQGWKDSQDSIFHADGTPAELPIALCEVQGYVYRGRKHFARIARSLGFDDVAAEHDRRAEDLRRRFEDAFWCEELSTYALALDGEKRPCRVMTSNAGHALFSGIASPGRAERTAETLLGRRGFSGWGIRTVAAEQARYNPMAYHNGSIWPHDNALIAMGFARYGLRSQALRLFEGLFDAAAYMDLRRLPELFCGFARKQRKGPTFYPVACAPQAWASATPLALLQATLGLTFDHGAREIRFEQPLLPYFLEEVRLRNLRLDGGRADVVLYRYGTEVALRILHRSPGIRVVVVH